ncbi:hypothetical protein [Acinetobacter piscicola]|uniref:hypothetical protein n=1 Tax=Acinetobacter piscicola TaxID=2006115 RepID=UPI0013EB0C3F|nr:hypothetical protein [Acinetobacter piscicola]
MIIKKEKRPKVKENTVLEKTTTVEILFKSLSEMPCDFYSEDRIEEPPQEREDL